MEREDRAFAPKEVGRVKKQEWKRPELIVLVREVAGESILVVCKLPSYPTGGPDSVNNDCREFDIVCGTGCASLDLS